MCISNHFFLKIQLVYIIHFDTYLRNTQLRVLYDGLLKLDTYWRRFKIIFIVTIFTLLSFWHYPVVAATYRINSNLYFRFSSWSVWVLRTAHHYTICLVAGGA